MKKHLLLTIACSLAALGVWSQDHPTKIDLFKLASGHQLKVLNREVKTFSNADKQGIYFPEMEGEGLAWIDGVNLGNGVIEVDIKGRDVLQKSFLGVAFHCADENNLDVVYFRPFNFRSADSVRRIHAVQYVSYPDFSWNRLRTEQNGRYEKGIVPAPDASEWFHARIVVQYPRISVFVNSNAVASLTVDKLNDRKTGRIGLWVGPNSDASFANLTISLNGGRLR